MSQLLSRLSYRSAGESHGRCVSVILEGLPRGMAIDLEAVDAELARRQGGAGRGGRQRIESDRAVLVGGVRGGSTIGSPLALTVENRDHKIESCRPEPTRPRPGHADLSGCYRYLDHDIRGTLERASARETAGRVAAGAVARQLLTAVGCEIVGFVRRVAAAELPEHLPGPLAPDDLAALRSARDGSRLYTLDADADAAMLAEVQRAAAAGDTVGGVVEVHAVNTLPGLGSCNQWNERLDARLAAAIVSIPAFKGAEIGAGFAAAAALGSEVHDEILPAAPPPISSSMQSSIVPESTGRLRRATNRAGGLEGGMTNGENVIVRGAMKPISTLRQPLASVDLATGQPDAAGYERSDVCAISAASVIAEAMVALVLADAALTRIGGETLTEFQDRYRLHAARAADIGRGE